MSAQPDFTAQTDLPPEARAAADEAKKILADAQQIQITTPAEYEDAGHELKRIKDRLRNLDAQRKDLTRPLDEAKRRIMDFFRPPQRFLEDAERTIKRGMLAFDQEQERKRREEEARLRELQRQEQERLAREAEEREAAARRKQEEADRLAREAQAAEDAEARRKAEEDAARLKAEAEEDRATADAVLEQAATMPTAIVPEERVKVEGVKKQVRYSAEVTDLKALARAVADGKIPEHAISANMTFLRQQAVSMKEAFSIPGCKLLKKETLAA